MTNLLNLQERKDLRFQVELSDSLQDRAQTNGLRYFVPTGKQEEFIKSIGQGDKFIGIFSGGNRAGKTCLETAILGNIIFGQQNDWFNYPLFRGWKYSKRVRIGTNPKNLEEIGAIQTGINEWWNPDKYTAHKQGHTYNALYKAGDWTIDLMSYQQSVTEWESAQLGLVLFDEPPPRDIFDATVARLADGGLILIFMTPLADAGYLFDDLLQTPNDRVTVTYCDIEDACKTHGVRGFRDHSLIANMISFLDPDEVEARAHGKPMHLSGAIYKGFNPSVHIADNFRIPANWQRVNICDPHDAFPFGFIWVAIDPSNNYWVYDEYPDEPFEKIHGTNLTFKDYRDIVKTKEEGIKISRRILDPNFGAKRIGLTGKTVQNELYELGLSYELCWNDDLSVGHNSVRDRLKYDTTRPIDGTNKPRLFILRQCRNTWVSMMRYGWKPIKSDEQSDSQKVAQKYKHFADMIRYLSVTNPVYDIPVEDRIEKLGPLEQRVWREVERISRKDSYVDSELGSEF